MREKKFLLLLLLIYLLLGLITGGSVTKRAFKYYNLVNFTSYLQVVPSFANCCIDTGTSVGLDRIECIASVFCIYPLLLSNLKLDEGL